MRKALLLGALALIAAALLVVPMPLYVMRPGSALPVAERVDLAIDEHAVSGQLLMTTVRVGRPTAAEAFTAWLDGDRAVLPRAAVVPEGVDDREYFRAQRRLFAESTRLAAAVGLQAAGFDVTVSGDGAQIAAVLPDGPAEGELREGDVVVEAGGETVAVASDLVEATARADAGDPVTLTIRRGDERRTVQVELDEVRGLGRPGLGVAIRTLDREIVLPFDVRIDAGRIGGPSAGLMVALTVYDLATDGDLTDGRTVAGTGTIDADGEVGEVGGVTQKVAAAAGAGAGVFLVPAAEAAAARDAAPASVRVVPVETLDDAIAALGGGGA